MFARTHRANIVDEGFIKWFYWIAICFDFVEKRNILAAKTFSRAYYGHLFLQDSKTQSRR